MLSSNRYHGFGRKDQSSADSQCKPIPGRVSFPNAPTPTDKREPSLSSIAGDATYFEFLGSYFPASGALPPYFPGTSRSEDVLCPSTCLTSKKKKKAVANNLVGSIRLPNHIRSFKVYRLMFANVPTGFVCEVAHNFPAVLGTLSAGVRSHRVPFVLFRTDA